MKYMGSKRRIVNDILPIMLKYNKNNVFVDLFCGSCSVIQEVPTTYRRIANDKNRYLIEMFKSLVDGKQFPSIINKETYSFHRDLYNKERKGEALLTREQYAEIGWYGWMASYNGRFFSGGYSGHNVLTTNGKPRDYIKEQINNTLKSLSSLKGIEFVSCDYNDVDIPLDSIVYCDIPYKGTKQYETSKNFDYERFYEWCRKNKDNYKIFISEYSMPSDFICVWQKEITNAMNQTKTYKPIEILYTI